MLLWKVSAYPILNSLLGIDVSWYAFFDKDPMSSGAIYHFCKYTTKWPETLDCMEIFFSSAILASLSVTRQRQKEAIGWVIDWIDAHLP